MRSILRRYPLLSFFALSYTLSWAWWLPLYWAPLAGWQVHFHHALGCFGPAAAAKILLFNTEGWPGLWRLGASAARWRVDWRWWAVALIGPLTIAGAAAELDALVPGNPPHLSSFGLSTEFPAMSSGAFFLYNLLIIGFDEETDWRAYAQPQLDARYGPRAAVGLMALGWAGWHLPLFFYRPGLMQLSVGGTIGWAVSILTGATLLLCAVLHATLDIAFTSADLSPTVVSIIGALVTVAGLVVFQRLPARQSISPAFIGAPGALIQ